MVELFKQTVQYQGQIKEGGKATLLPLICFVSGTRKKAAEAATIL